MNENDTMLIVHELRRLRSAVSTLPVVVVLCAAAIALALWNSEFMLGVLILLGIILVPCVIAGIIGAATGKAINRLQNGEAQRTTT